ncbi:hypothetical protein [Actinoplanes subglobosus]|uniref:Uncharacterized protein n=1 Tax=Actinoplanes subglobosus TaxID=1547892 RepID=A0ABV8IQL6_9ACTN
MIVGLVAYFVVVGLDKADKIASTIGVVLAALALGGPYLLPPQKNGNAPAPTMVVEGSGSATATGGGRANTGVQHRGDDSGAQVRSSGDARADGPGSNANTGVQRLN